MTLFSVTCETCHTRLKVRDKAIVGQIHACPKCGSMVLIRAAPPESQDDGSSDEVAKNPLPTGDFADAADLLESPPSPPQQQAAPADAAEPDLVTKPDTRETKPESAAPGDSEQETTDTEPSVEDQVEPPAVEVPRSQIKQLVLMVGAVALGLVIAVACFIFAVSRGGDPDTEVAKTSGATEPDTKQGQETKVADAKKKTKSATKGTPIDPGGGNPKSKKTTKGKTPNAGAKKGVTNQQKKTKGQGQKKKEAEGPMGLTPRADTKLDPGLQAVLNTFEPLMKDEDPLEKVLNSKTTKKKKPTVKQAKVIVPATPSIVDSRAQLTRQIKEIEFTKTPLEGFVRFVSDLTAIPVTLDTDAMAELGVTVSTHVNVRLKDATVAKIVTAALHSVGLSWVLDEGHLVVTRPSSALTRQVHPLGNLVSNDQDSKDLGELMRGLLQHKEWNGKEKGKVVAKGKTLEVQAFPADHVHLERLLGLLHKARGLETASAATNPTIQVPVKLAKRLEARLTANFLRQTNVVEILDYIQAKSGIHLLVDWRSVYHEGLTPQTDAKLSAIGIPTKQAIELLLKRYPTSLRVVDDQTLQITSQAKMKKNRLYGVYSVKDLVNKDLTGERLIRRIRLTIGEDVTKDSRLAFDKLGKTILVAMPLDQHHRLQSLLKGYRKQP